jgi:hypothetical protein
MHNSDHDRSTSVFSCCQTTLNGSFTRHIGSLHEVTTALERERLGEGDKAHLCRAVVGLTEVTYGG